MINDRDEYMTDLLVGFALANETGTAMAWKASRLISCKMPARIWEVLYVGTSKAQ